VLKGRARRLGPGHPLVLFGVLVLLTGVWFGVAAEIYREVGPAAPAVAPAGPPDGYALYAQHCAQCHGTHGDGNVGISPHLSPPARNFGEGKFRLASTLNGIPTDDDLRRILRHGVPGSAMPAFASPGGPSGDATGGVSEAHARLSDAELDAVIGTVRRLTRDGVFLRLRRAAEQAGDIDMADLYATAEQRTRPGDVLGLPGRFPDPTPRSVTHGREVFVKSCASCHGPDGRGDGPQVKDLKNEDGSPARPRDLTAGRFKGGEGPERIYSRIMLGMPGTPMPSSATLPQSDVFDLVNYVRSLSQPADTSRVAATGSSAGPGTEVGTAVTAGR
jgi:mono/diheme cytochrome c family protein